jgi:hypothetical protein
VTTDLDPTDFSFATREQFRPFHLLAKNFVELDDRFDRNTLGNYIILRPGPVNEDDGGVGVRDGRLRFTERNDSNDYYTVLKSRTAQRAPFATVIIDVAAQPEGAVYAGLYRDELNFVHAYYDKNTQTVGLEARISGVDYAVGTTQQFEQRLFEAPFRFAFAVNENRVIALVSSPSDLGNWRPIIERDVFYETRNAAGGPLDLRREDVLATYTNGFGARSRRGRTISFDRARAGYYGEVGVRDPHVVQYADGTPYIEDNKLYFTLTNAGLGFFEKAHWGVWTMDLSDYTNIEQVGNIFWRNADAPPADPSKVLGHHAGQIILDQRDNRWIVVVSSWGDFGPQGGDGGPENNVDTANPPVDILYDEMPSSTDLLNGVHILTGRKHPVNLVPRPTQGKWDPGLTRIDGRWYLAYVIANDLFSDFQPALARSPVGADHTVQRFVGTDDEKVATEGPIIQKLGGKWRLFASCGDDEPPQFEGRYPIYFLEAEENDDPDYDDPQLRFDGYLDAPHPTNIPHPMIVPLPTRPGSARTKYIMITFNGDQYYIERLGYGTHGDFYVMQAEQTVRGSEF